MTLLGNEDLVPPSGGDRVRIEPRLAEADPPPCEPAEERSLIEDVSALIDDSKTYLHAELNFQKTRASFAADRAKRAAIFGVAAATFGWLALVGLTVGLIIALTPLIGAWGATAVVVGVLVVGAAILGWLALGRARELAGAFRSNKKNEAS